MSVVAGEQIVFYGYASPKSPGHCTVVGGLDAETGAALWEWRGPEQPIPGTGGSRLKAAGGNVHVILHAGIFALRGRDGHLLWHAPGGVSITRAQMCAGGAKPV